MTDRVQRSLDVLLQGRHDTRRPGPVGRWISELFNERPWLIEGRDGASSRNE
ncbi:MAG: hypothetical protein H0X59_08285 [Chloroflexi bacterium]|nr:hypothetical protein [Chloroflexota bacterium]